MPWSNHGESSAAIARPNMPDHSEPGFEGGETARECHASRRGWHRTPRALHSPVALGGAILRTNLVCCSRCKTAAKTGPGSGPVFKLLFDENQPTAAGLAPAARWRGLYRGG